MNNYIKINSDNWDDAGQVWFVMEYKKRPDSTAIELTLKDSFGKMETRVVPENQLEWIDDERI